MLALVLAALILLARLGKLVLIFSVRMEEGGDFCLELEDPDLYKEFDNDYDAQVAVRAPAALSDTLLAQDHRGQVGQEQQKPQLSSKLPRRPRSTSTPLKLRDQQSRSQLEKKIRSTRMFQGSDKDSTGRDKDKTHDIIDKNSLLKQRLKDHTERARLARADRSKRQKKLFKPIPISFPSPDRQDNRNPLDITHELPLGQDKQRSLSSSGSQNSSSSFGLDWSFGVSSTITPASIPHSRYKHLDNTVLLHLQSA